MTARIMGLETEFGVAYLHAGRRRLAADEAARAMFRDIVRADRSSNVFCQNGARLYLDVGNHPEYATAECLQLRDVLAQDRAGEAVMLGLAQQAERALAREGFEGTLHVFKNNLDSHGNSYGCHENYLVARDTALDELAAALVPFLVTRQLFCGAGVVTSSRASHSRTQPRFALSQRAQVVWEGVSSATTRSRPMINSRDEPHADASKYRRLHIIVGDSNLCEASTLLKVGATEMLLRYVESGAPLPVAAFESAAHTIREVSWDRHALLRCVDGRELRAVEVQRAHFEAVAAFTHEQGYPGRDDRVVLAAWDRILTALERDELDAVEREVDWVVKLRLLERFMQRTGADWADPRVAALDLLYHDIDPGRGLLRKLEAGAAVDRVTSAASVAAAEKTPPATRARIRGDFIRAARELGHPYSVDWSHVRAEGHRQVAVELPDPFADHDARVDALIEAMASDPGPDRFTPPPA